MVHKPTLNPALNGTFKHILAIVHMVLDGAPLFALALATMATIKATHGVTEPLHQTWMLTLCQARWTTSQWWAAYTRLPQQPHRNSFGVLVEPAFYANAGLP
jgi:Na+/H+-dicarboxylate symporter